MRQRRPKLSQPSGPEVDNEDSQEDFVASLSDGNKDGTITPHLFWLLVARLFAAGYSAIADCDETFNYWEPMHFITFGHGFQTWEYSPIYAMRSYLFLLPHAAASYVFAVLQGRPAAFFLTRGSQALVAVFAESIFVLAIGKRFGTPVGKSVAILLAFSPGMFVASVAFLPSSIAMLQVCVVWALWLRGHLGKAIFLGACAVVVVWPFVGLLFVPLGLHSLWKLGFVRAIGVALFSFAFWSLLSVAVDSYFYGYTVLPVFQILRYNVFDRKEHGGSELYGVESWDYYLRNGALNLNVVLPAAIGLPVLAVLSRLVPFPRRKEYQQLDSLVACGYVLVAYAWFILYSALPHKEERFLAPVYPLLVFAAAVAVHEFMAISSMVCERCCSLTCGFIVEFFVRRVGSLFLCIAIMLSLSRIAALQTGYTAPIPIYQALNSELSTFRQMVQGTNETHVCIGVEWYRFMTSFFLPDSRDHLSFVRFGPTGLLPAEFDTTLGTSGIPKHMNDRNQEETSRYIDPGFCDFLIDLDIGEGKGDLPDLRQQQWKTVLEVPFLDSSRSQLPWRAFYVPGKSAHRNVYAFYRLLRRTNLGKDQY